MSTEAVQPLVLEDAVSLAVALLVGEKVQTIDLPGTARCIAIVADGVPFYIHHIIDQLRRKTGVLESSLIDSVVADLIDSPEDPLHFGYFEERIGAYYTPEEKTLALPLLDTLAVSNAPLLPADLFNRIKSHVPVTDDEALRKVVQLLERDHYIHRIQGAYCFQFALIARAWCGRRGLAT